MIEDPQIVAEPSRETPFWSYRDVLLMVGPTVIAFAVVFTLAGSFSFLRRWKPGQIGLLAEGLFYVVWIGALWLTLSRYGQAVIAGLGWKVPERRYLLLVVLAGPVIAVLLGLMGTLLQTPEIPNPFRPLMTSQAWIAVLGLYVVVLGPIFEEIAFRGFLQPLFIRSFGPLAGILLTALPFGLLHGSQYSWQWQIVLIVTLAGAAFGGIRFRTGSTLASTIVHGAYNLTQFTAFLVSEYQKHTLPW